MCARRMRRAHHLRSVPRRIVFLRERVIHVNLLPGVSTSAARDDVILVVIVLVVRTARRLRAASLHHVRLSRVRVPCACVHDVIGVVNRWVVVERARVSRCGGRRGAFGCVHITFVGVARVVRELRATSGAR